MFRSFGIVIGLLIPLCYGEFPKSVPQCKAEDHSCIAAAATEIVGKYGKTGNPELAFPVYNPYHLDEVKVNQDSSKPINVNIQFSSADVTGLSDQVFDKVLGFAKDPSKAKMELHGVIPKFHVTGNYKADGRVLLLPISGDGKFDLTLTNLKSGIKIKTSVVEKDGKHYYKISQVKTLIEPESFHIDLTNLFNGNKELSDSFLEVINKNWKEAWEEIAPPILEITENIIKKITQGLFDKYSHEELYLPD